MMSKGKLKQPGYILIGVYVARSVRYNFFLELGRA